MCESSDKRQQFLGDTKLLDTSILSLGKEREERDDPLAK
jgi:hypothetical protein